MEFHVSLIGRKHLSDEIYRQLRRAIIDGRVRAGESLPPSRELAGRLSVSRTTVTVAYDRLVGEGFVESRVGAGMFVIGSGARPPGRVNRRIAADLRPRPVWDAIPLTAAFARCAEFDFRTGVPDPSLFPHDRWRRSMTRALRGDALGSGAYGEPAGYRGLREAIAHPRESGAR